MIRSAVDVARRCLCLEILAQRSVLETDEDASAEEARSKWASRVADLGIAFEAGEKAMLDRPVGKLTEDERDDLDGRATGAAVLLWALGRTATKPTFALADELVAEHGLLGDGSIPNAKTAAETATLRTEDELDAALSVFMRTRGKAKHPSDPEQIYAGVAAHHLTWILDAEMPFEHDIDLD